MERMTLLLGVLLMACCVPACSVPPQPDPKLPGSEVRNLVARRMSVVVVTAKEDLRESVKRGMTLSRKSSDSEGGSATPISPDGYFLTANHVLARMAGRHVFVIYGVGGASVLAEARVIWRSKGADLALLHIPAKTESYYQWSAPHRWLPEGSRVIHGGLATGITSGPGKLGTSLAPEGGLTGSRAFKIDIALQPGDSGGPLVDADGALIGINSSVEYAVPEGTPYFLDSEGHRPNTQKIASLIQKDRARHGGF